MLTPETLLLQDRQERSKMPEIRVAAPHVMGLLDVLQHLATSLPVQEAGVLLLRLMTVAKIEGGGQAHCKKTVNVILAAMSLPSSSSSTSSTNQKVRIATHSCGALRVLSSGHYSSHQQTKICMLEGGGLDLLTGALKLAPKDAVLQEQACGAIRNAAANNTDNKIRLGANPELFPLLSLALHNHPHNKGVVESALGALRNLLTVKQNRPSFSLSKFQDTILLSMRGLLTEPVVQEHGLTLLKFLGTFEMSEGTRSRFVSSRDTPLTTRKPQDELIQHIGDILEHHCSKEEVSGARKSKGKLGIAQERTGDPVPTEDERIKTAKKLAVLALGVLQTAELHETHEAATCLLPLVLGVQKFLLSYEAVQVQGLALLSMLALKSPELSKILQQQCEHRVLGLVMDVMETHRAHSAVQANAMALLWSLSYRCLDLKRLMGEQGFIGSILNSFKFHPYETSVLEVGCGVLKNLTVLRENALRVSAAGGIQIVLAAMQRHATSATLQEQACSLIRNISLVAITPDSMPAHASEAASRRHSRNEKLEEASFASGLMFGMLQTALPQIIQAMTRHAKTEAVVEQGSGALQNITWDNAAVHASMARLRGPACGVRAMVEGMKNYPVSVLVHEAALGALCNLTSDADICKKMSSSETIAVILRAMRTHATAPQVLTAASAVLANVACDNPSASRLMGKQGALALLLLILESSSNDLAVTSNVLGALHNVMLASSENESRFQVLNGPAVVKAALALHLTDNDLQETGKVVLGLAAHSTGLRSSSCSCMPSLV